jgi:hypothetical protein
MVNRTRRRGVIGGSGAGGVVAVDRDTPSAYGETGPSITSETLSVIPELSISIPASEGDVLLVSLSGTFGTNAGSAQTVFFDYTVDGIPQFPDTLEHLVRSVDTDLVSWTDIHVVTAGEITAGEVTVEPLWGSLNAALQLRPVFNVVNLGATA